jgi:hypothetical protein
MAWRAVLGPSFASLPSATALKFNSRNAGAPSVSLAFRPARSSPVAARFVSIRSTRGGLLAARSECSRIQLPGNAFPGSYFPFGRYLSRSVLRSDGTDVSPQLFLRPLIASSDRSSLAKAHNRARDLRWRNSSCRRLKRSRTKGLQRENPRCAAGKSPCPPIKNAPSGLGAFVLQRWLLG